MKKIDISNYSTLLFFIIRGCFLGICSSNLYNVSKQNSWLSIIIASIIGILPVLMYYYIIKNYPDKNIIEIINHTFGKQLGTFINTIIVLFIILFSSSVFYNLIVFISTQYLYRTPNIAIASMFGFCFYYILKKGINALSKVSTILFYIFILLFILTLLGLIPQINLSNLQPFNEIGVLSIFGGTLEIICLNIAPIYLMTLIPYNKISHNNKLLKNIFTFYIIALITILCVNVSVIAIYGNNLAKLFQYSEFHLLKRLSLIGFIERTENILSIQWIFGMVIIIVMSLCYIKEYIKIYTKKSNFIIEFSLVFISIVLALNIFKTNTDAFSFYLYILPILNSIFYVLIPLIIIIIIRYKKIMLK